jgi:menaquinone-specific isochorismate synthase
VGAGHRDASQRSPDRLTVRTVPASGHGDLAALLPGPAPLAWLRQGEGIVGWGEAARITLPAGEDRFTAGEKWLRALLDGADVDDRVGEPGCGPVAFASFTFDSASDGSVLVVPRVIAGRRNGRAWLTTIEAEQHGPRQPVPVQPALEQPAPAGPGAAAPQAAPAGVHWSDGSLDAAAWQRAVAAAVARIRSGQLAKVVLARDLSAHAPGGIDVRVLLRRLAARYPDCYTFACAGLIGATPELLIRRQGTDIRSLVLAGTAPRDQDPARDARLGAALLSSVKDTEEHQYAVAGVRAALAPLCDPLLVDGRPSLLRLANVQHLASAVTGRLAGAGNGHTSSVLALAAALHPTGAVCGTPTEAAMDVIRELEGMDRGRYAGPVGWVDADGNGEMGIALRCAEVDGEQARLFAGCGIVAGSDPAAELAEAQAKFAPVRGAIEG